MSVIGLIYCEQLRALSVPECTTLLMYECVRSPSLRRRYVRHLRAPCPKLGEVGGGLRAGGGGACVVTATAE